MTFVTIEDDNSEHLISRDELGASMNIVKRKNIVFNKILWNQLCQSPLERIIERNWVSISRCWQRCGFAFTSSIILSTVPHLNCNTCFCFLVSPILKNKSNYFLQDSKSTFRPWNTLTNPFQIRTSIWKLCSSICTLGTGLTVVLSVNVSVVG